MLWHLLGMAPTFLSCKGLSKVYSPLNSRHLNHLPGPQTRSVPFVRPTQPISRSLMVVVTAVSEIVERDSQGESQDNGAAFRNAQAGYTTGTLAVHGGERGGRPRVSGGRARAASNCY